MKLLDNQLDKPSLSKFGEEACRFFIARDFKRLADTFGYAMAYNRDIASAIEADFEHCLSGHCMKHKQQGGTVESVICPPTNLIHNDFFPAAFTLAHLALAAAAIFARPAALIFRLPVLAFEDLPVILAQRALCAAAIANLPARLILRLIFRASVAIPEEPRVAESSFFNFSISSTRSAAFLNWCEASDSNFIM
jgi:hypothetical protein